MKNALFITILLLLLFGCHSQQPSSTDDILNKRLNQEIISKSEMKILHSSNPIVSYDTLYPVSVEFYDSLLYVTLAKSDKCIDVRNKNNGKQEYIMGNKGYGPDDVLSLDVMMNSYALKAKYNGIAYYDLNKKRIFLAKGKNQLTTITSISDLVYPSSELSIGDKYWIGRKIDLQNETLCQIYDLTTNTTKVIKAYPDIKEIDNRVNRNYLYSSKIAFNEEKNRIILGMYFGDLIQVYDLNGHNIKTFSLTQDYDPVNSMKIMFEGADYIGFNQLYATKNYCYLRRVLIDGKTHQSKEMQIIRIDWDGNIKSIYQLDDLIVGGFSVDEENGTIIGIVPHTDEEIEEYYNIVMYKIETDSR